MNKRRFGHTIQRCAALSDDGVCRYALIRVWDAFLPTLVFIMLNPSTGDASVDDQTIDTCMMIARNNGYGKIVIVNLYAYRTLSPQVLKNAGWLIGEHNDTHIENAVTQPGVTVCCAWGAHARHDVTRPATVLATLDRAHVTPHVLGLTKGGQPRHPLYMPHDSKLVPWRFQ